MLSVSSAAGSGAAKYYSELSQDGYYSERENSPGEWFGKGAHELGLSGRIDTKDLKFLLAGYGIDGQKLVQNAGDPNRRVGIDMTFSAVKSVSTLYALLNEKGREDIARIHDEAVKATLRYADAQETFISRRGKGGVHHEAAKPVFATYRHATSRELEPALHTHALCLNVSVRPDGTTGTIEQVYIYRKKMELGAFYRAEVAQRIQRELGLEIEQRGAFWEVKGVPQSLMEDFSTRSIQIERYCAERNDFSPEMKAEAAKATRAAKQNIPLSELSASWQERGRQHGFAREEAEQLLAKGRERAVFERPEWAKSEERKLLEKAKENLLAKDNHFTEGEYIRECITACYTHKISPERAAAIAREGLEKENGITLLDSEKREFAFTEVLKQEERLLKNAEKLDSKDSDIKAGKVDSALNSKATESLYPEQKLAVEYLTRDSGNLAFVNGAAGTGKTTMLNAAREVWEKGGKKVVGAAFTGKAARELEKGAGIESKTIDSLIMRADWYEKTIAWKIGSFKELDRFRDAVPPPLEKGSVLVVDEASMIDTAKMSRLLEVAKRYDAKIAFVGDTRQLQAIGVGAPFRSLTERYETAQLTNIVRQKEEWAREAVVLFSEGKAEEALKMYEERGLITQKDGEKEAFNALVEDWSRAGGLSNPKENFISAVRNKDVDTLNLAAQEARKQAGELGSRNIKIAGRTFYKGDRILLRRNDYEIGVVNGDFGNVRSIDLLGRKVTVELDTGEQVSFTAKGTLGNKYQDVYLGYAGTVYSQQGQTVDRSFIYAKAEEQNQETSYVQASRARLESRFYIPDTDSNALSRAAQYMSRTRERGLAHDIKIEKVEEKVSELTLETSEEGKEPKKEEVREDYKAQQQAHNQEREHER